MGRIIAITVGLMIWVTLWSIGARAFDAFLITLLITISAVAVATYKPMLLPGDKK